MVDIAALERRVAALEDQLAALSAPAAPPASAPPPAPAPTLPPPAPAPSRSARVCDEAPASRDIRHTEALEGRVLAVVGAAALVVGIALFLGLAISRGWIGEEERTIMAALGSLALLFGGAWAYERRGRYDAALAVVAAGTAGGFATIAVAAQGYDLVPAGTGVAAAVALGALAAALALRWESATMAVLGIVGGLAAPLVAGLDPADHDLAPLLAITYAAAALVAVRLRRDELALLAFAVATPQWLLGDAQWAPYAFGAITLAAGLPLRSDPIHLLNALVTGTELLSGLELVAAWSALAVLAPPVTALGLLLLAAAHVLLFEAPLEALAEGSDATGLIAVAAVAVAAAARRLWLPAGVAAFYLASVALVTAVPGEAAQPALSALWTVVGVGALFARVREPAWALLALAIGKVFVVDLAELDEMTRVASFLALGTLLLAGAFLWQRTNSRSDVESPAS